MSDELSEEELFQNGYHHFHRNLTILEKDCVTQCNMVGNFNVAWELQDELLRDAFVVLNYPWNGLNSELKGLVEKLMADLEAIPKSVMSGDRTVEGSQRDMSHPCWTPLREQAANLLKALEPATKLNAEYFRTSDA
jgi:hypothetical protein